MSSPSLLPRLFLSLCIAVAFGQSAVPPPPEKGEYRCIQLNLTAALPLPGLPPTTTVTSAPSPFGNMVLDGAGQYRMTVGRNASGTYRYDSSTGRVTFTGVLASMTNTFGTRGATMSFEFRGQGVSFSCSATGSRQFGDSSGSRTGTIEGGNSRPNGNFVGRIYYADVSGAHRIDVATGKTTALGLSGNFDVRSDGVVVYVNKQGEMILTNDQGSNARRVNVYGSKNYSPRISPDGTRIAYYGMQKPDGLEAAMMAAYSNANLEPLVVSADGRLVAAFGTAYAQPTWTPDGRLIVAGAKPTNAQGNGATTGLFISDVSLRRLARIAVDFDAPHSPAVSPDGTRLAFANGPNLWVCNLDGSSLRKLYDGSTRHVLYPAWSPDGTALTFTDNQVVGIVSLAGEELPLKTADGGIVRSDSELLWMR
jgi:dipeptidyl aminopeptidase/acylaminoacyl peptidase